MSSDTPATSGIHIEGDVSGQIGIGSSVTQSQSDAQPQDAMDSTTVLFWAANPVDTDALRLDEEVRTIEERLRASENRDIFDLKQQWAVRFSDLSDGLLRYEPQIVHFSGHGNPTGDLVFEGNDGLAIPVDIHALADLFRIAGDKVRCVVFNACYSTSQAEAISEYIDCVVGTSKAIGDESAIRFAGGFYRALGYGRSVQTAFDLGCNEIDLAALGEHATPQLHTRSGVDASSVSFIPR